MYMYIELIYLKLNHVINNLREISSQSVMFRKNIKTFINLCALFYRPYKSHEKYVLQGEKTFF